MGQSISLPHKLQQPSRKTERIRLHDHDHHLRQSGSFVRRSSMGGRLRSYGVILYQAPSTTTSMEAQGPISSEDLPTSAPSPVMNDTITVGKRTKQRWPIEIKTSCSTITTMTTATTLTTMTTERGFAAVTPTRSTRTPRRLGSSSTAAAVQSSPAPVASLSSSFNDAIVPVVSKSRVANDRIGLSLTASAVSSRSPSSVLVCSSSSGLRAASPVRPRLPNLHLGELEQIFAAIVTSNDSSARVKLALST